MFSKRTSKKGVPMYFKDGHLISKKAIPDGAAVLDHDFDLDIERVDEPSEGSSRPTPLEVPQTPLSERTCLFCGEPAESQRFVNLTTVDLCLEHYQERTLGEIAHKLKEQNG